MKRLAFILPLLLAWTVAFNQAKTQTGFVGKFTFQSFAAGGTSDVAGLLDAFSDQTNQYFASGIQVGDIVWDNQGNRWEVMVVNSANLLQANVDLRDINEVGGTPLGVGFVSRETPNMGLSLFVPDNNIGISQQLKSRIESHNMLLIDQYVAQNRDSVFTGATAADTSTISNPAVGDILVNADGSTAYYDGDSWVVSPAGTWLKPELEAGNDVTISTDNTLRFQSDDYSFRINPEYVQQEHDETGFHSRNFLEESSLEMRSYFFQKPNFNGPDLNLMTFSDSLRQFPRITLMKIALTGDDTFSTADTPNGSVLGALNFVGSGGISAIIESLSTEDNISGDSGGQLVFKTSQNGTKVPIGRLVIDQDGAIRLPTYGNGSFTGTVAKVLAVDDIGNVIEVESTGVGAEPDGNGIYSGSGEVPDSTVSTVSGYYTLSTMGDTDSFFDGGSGLQIRENAASLVSGLDSDNGSYVSYYPIGFEAAVYTPNTSTNFSASETAIGMNLNNNGFNDLSVNIEGIRAQLGTADAFRIVDSLNNNRLVVTQNANISLTATTGLTATTTSGVLGITHTGSSGQLIVRSHDERATFQGEDTRIKGDTIMTLDVADGNTELTIKDSLIQVGYLADDNAPVKLLGLNANRELVQTDTLIQASNGLNDADPSASMDFELGGPLERHTTITGENKQLNLDSLNRFYVRNTQGNILLETDTLGDRQASAIIGVSNTILQNFAYGDDKKASVEINQSGEVILIASNLDGSTRTRLVMEKEYFQLEGVAVYADDAAADADSGLPTGGMYQVTGDRALRIKP